jgi:two-component system nitrogen regulation sensor histidine kinase GlnL
MSDTRSAAFYRRVLDHLVDSVLVFDELLRLVYMSSSGEMMFGFSARQLKDGDVLSVLFPEGQLTQEEFRHVIDSGISLSKRNLAINQLHRSLTVNATVTPLFDDKKPGVLLQVQQVDRQLRISMGEQLVAQQNAAKMLLRGLAHEIKNPLGGLRGAAQLLDRELKDEELKEYTGIIIEESDRLQSLLDRMLAPNKPPRKSRLNIHRVLERIRQLVQAEAPASVRVLRDYDPSIPDIQGDPDQLIQAVLNIVRNALQAVGSSGEIVLRTRIHRQVTIGTRRSRLAIRVDIIDDGPGIDPELMNQIFYPMVTGRAEGTGLGLSIAQSLINQHGGLVECTSSPGCTVFSIFLPLEKEHEERSPSLGSR